MLNNVRALIAAVVMLPSLAMAQTPAAVDRAAIERVLGRSSASLAGGVVRVAMPRTDLSVRVGSTPIRANFALGSWVAFLPTTHGAMAMGDIVVLESELANVLLELQRAGIEQSAIHHHLAGESPSVLYIHLHAHGDAVKIAEGVRAAIARTGTPAPGSEPPVTPLPAALDSAALATALGRAAPVNGGVMQFAVPRPESLRSGGHLVPASMGLATVINFQPTAEGRAAITGDFVLLGSQVNPVIRALQAHGITPTSLHNHLLDDEPRLFFLHFWAEDDAVKLARGLRAALDVMAAQP
jgi:hypothetical protein